MKIIYKKCLISLALGIAVIFGIAGCGSTRTQDDLQSKIEELQSRIAEMQNQINEMEDRLTEMDKKSYAGEFYSLQVAYDNGYLTKENLESIAYYNNNLLPYPESIDETVVKFIKEDAANKLRTMERDPILEAKAEDFEIVKYYGTYNGSYVILLNDPYFGHPAVIDDEWVTIGEVSFHKRGHGEIIVWKK